MVDQTPRPHGRASHESDPHALAPHEQPAREAASGAPAGTDRHDWFGGTAEQAPGGAASPARPDAGGIGHAGRLSLRAVAFTIVGALATLTAILAPLPYGGIYDTWLAGLVAAASGWVVLLALLAERGRGPELPVVLLAAAFPATVATMMGLQSVLAERLASPVWLEIPLEADPFATSARGAGYVELGQAILFALMLLCGHLAGRSGAGLRYLRALAYAGALYALVAIGYEILAPDRLLITTKQAYLGFLTTPFVNRNTAATFYGTFAIVLAVFAARARLGRSPRAAATADIVALALVFVALALTGSRAGIALSLLGMVVAYLGTTRGYRRTIGVSRAPFVIILMVPVLLALMVLSERFADDSVAGGGRLGTYISSIAMIMERPLQGWGIGTFADTFPAFREGAIRGIWDRAHSTPLEWAVEGGIPYALVLIAILVAIGARSLHVLAMARQPYRGTMRRERGLAVRPLVAVLTLGLALSHSMLDFSLDITGYLAVCAFAIGLGTTSLPPGAYVPHEPDVDHGARPRGNRWQENDPNRPMGAL